ncbi:MAG TPA: hypothetical protein PLF26_12995 [Blastocatellia bacterium]|nr:hypothetical protein [Blastocatellia bacterium]
MPWNRSRKIIVVAIALVLGAAAGCVWWYMRAPQRVDMARYVPESALAFFEIDSVPRVASGLTSTEAWKSLAGPLGLSSQLDYAGSATDVLGRLGLGPDDVVALGRAQVCLVLTGMEAGAEPSPETDESAATIVIRPKFALVVKTHTSESTAKQLAETRVRMLARRAYGEQVVVEESDYGGARIRLARGPSEGRQMVWTSIGDVVVIGNDLDALRAVLDAGAERAPSLAGSFLLTKLRAELDADSGDVFAYFSRAGVSKIVGVGPGVIAGTITADADRMVTVSRLVGSVSEGLIQAMAYCGTVTGGRVVDRYFAIFAPRVDEAMTQSIRPQTADQSVLDVIPAAARDVTVVRIERPGESLQALLTTISSRVDAAVAVTIGQFAIEARRSYGVTPEVPVSPLLGDGVAFADLGDDGPVVAVFEVRDQAGLLAIVERYLRDESSRISSETYASVEILKSSNEDGRAASFLGRYLVLGTRDQIVRCIDARAAGTVMSTGALHADIAAHPATILASQRVEPQEAAELLVALSGAVRATDGSADLAERPDIRDAARALAPTISRSELRNGGVYTETTSAVGNFSYLTTLLSD